MATVAASARAARSRGIRISGYANRGKRMRWVNLPYSGNGKAEYAVRLPCRATSPELGDLMGYRLPYPEPGAPPDGGCRSRARSRRRGECGGRAGAGLLNGDCRQLGPDIRERCRRHRGRRHAESHQHDRELRGRPRPRRTPRPACRRPRPRSPSSFTSRRTAGCHGSWYEATLPEHPVAAQCALGEVVRTDAHEVAGPRRPDLATTAQRRDLGHHADGVRPIALP